MLRPRCAMFPPRPRIRWGWILGQKRLRLTRRRLPRRKRLSGMDRWVFLRCRHLRRAHSKLRRPLPSRQLTVLLRLWAEAIPSRPCTNPEWPTKFRTFPRAEELRWSFLAGVSSPASKRSPTKAEHGVHRGKSEEAAEEFKRR